MLAPAIACVRIGAYACDGDDDACAGAPGGRCEPTGYCSYPDAECPSGARYSEFAGPYADECTPDDGGDTSTNAFTSIATSESSSTTESSTSTNDATSTGGPQPGDVQWQFTYDGGAGDDAFKAVAVFGAGFVVAGQQDVVDQGGDALVIAYDGPEVPRWMLVHDFAGGLDQIEDLVISPSAEVFVTGEHSPMVDVFQGWGGCFAVESGAACSGWELDGGQVATGGFAGRGVAYGSDGLVVMVGAESSLDGGFVDVRFDWNQEAWPRAATDAQLLAALAVGERKFVAGTLADGLWLGEATELAIEERAALPGPSAGPDAIQQLATDGESIVAVGWVTTPTSRDGWIARFDLAGEPIWEETEGDAALDEEIEGVAIADDGTIFTAGYVTDLGADSWVASWTAEGELDWSRNDLPLGEGHDIARDVDVMDDGVLVVGEATGSDGALDGYAMLLVR
jgi:hypothetical protein